MQNVAFVRRMLPLRRNNGLVPLAVPGTILAWRAGGVRAPVDANTGKQWVSGLTLWYQPVPVLCAGGLRPIRRVIVAEFHAPVGWVWRQRLRHAVRQCNSLAALDVLFS